jgi:hypothetical protein
MFACDLAISKETRYVTAVPENASRGWDDVGGSHTQRARDLRPFARRVRRARRDHHREGGAGITATGGAGTVSLFLWLG